MRFGIDFGWVLGLKIVENDARERLQNMMRTLIDILSALGPISDPPGLRKFAGPKAPRRLRAWFSVRTTYISQDVVLSFQAFRLVGGHVFRQIPKYGSRRGKNTVFREK